MSAKPNLRSMRAIEADQTLASIMRGIAATLVVPFPCRVCAPPTCRLEEGREFRVYGVGCRV